MVRGAGSQGYFLAGNVLLVSPLSTPKIPSSMHYRVRPWKTAMPRLRLQPTFGEGGRSLCGPVAMRSVTVCETAVEVAYAIVLKSPLTPYFALPGGSLKRPCSAGGVFF